MTTLLGPNAKDLIKRGKPLPADTTHIQGQLDLAADYKHPLPPGLKRVGGLDLTSYEHPLPERLTQISGSLYINSHYKHPMPPNLRSIGASVTVESGYVHRLPESLRRIGGNVRCYRRGGPILPDGLEFIGGRYNNRYDGLDEMPRNLRYVGYLILTDYHGVIPASLTTVRDLTLRGTTGKLPETLSHVRGELRLEDYEYKLPDTLMVSGQVRSSWLVVPSTRNHSPVQIASALIGMRDRICMRWRRSRYEGVNVLNHAASANPAVWARFIYPSLFEEPIEDVIVTVSKHAFAVKDALRLCLNLKGDGVSPFTSDAEKLECAAMHMAAQVSESALHVHAGTDNYDQLKRKLVSMVRRSFNASRREAERAARKSSRTKQQP